MLPADRRQEASSASRIISPLRRRASSARSRYTVFQSAIAAVTRASPLARYCCASTARSRNRPRRWKQTARARAFRASPLLSYASFSYQAQSWKKGRRAAVFAKTASSRLPKIILAMAMTVTVALLLVFSIPQDVLQNNPILVKLVAGPVLIVLYALATAIINKGKSERGASPRDG